VNFDDGITDWYAKIEESGSYSNPVAEAEKQEQVNYNEERAKSSPGRPFYLEGKVFTTTGEPILSPTLSATSAYTPDPKRSNVGIYPHSPPSPSPAQSLEEPGTSHYLTRYQKMKSRPP